MCCSGPSKPLSVRGQPSEFDIPFGALEPLQISIHGEDKILVVRRQCRQELSLHWLMLVMKNSDGVVGWEKVKGGSERGEREDKKDGNVLRAAPLTRPRLTSTDRTDHARPPTLI
jgi:hypothetical protein